MTNQQKEYFEALYADRLDSSRTFQKRSIRGIWTGVVEKYSDQAHFIYELLQNADDVGATDVRFEMHNNNLVFIHNGTRYFSVSNPDTEDEDSEEGRLGDLNAITSIANSSKKDKSTIGKFGVGFKAVFQYTATPEIYDPYIAFRLINYIVPELLHNDYPTRKPSETAFVFPYNTNDKPPQIASADIKNKLQSLTFPLLFLQNLKNIAFDGQDTTGQYSKRVLETLTFDHTTAQNIALEKTINHKTEKEYLWLFTRTDSSGNNYCVGYFHNKDGKLIPKDYPAFCFFPTKATTNLHFIIHAPFLLTDSREGIQAAVPHNKEMIVKLGNLAADSLLYMKNIGADRPIRLINEDIFEILPFDSTRFVDEDNRDFLSFKPIYSAITNCLQIETILPSKNGYVHSRDAHWANTPQTSEIFGDKQLSLLISEKDAKWLSINSGSNSCYKSNYRLYTYITSTLGVELQDEDELIDNIDKEFIESQSTTWLLSFYKYIVASKDRVEAVTCLPIFLDDHNSACAPFKEDKGKQAILFIPSDGIEGFKTIKDSLYAHAETKALAKALEMSAPTLRDEIYNIILPKCEADTVEDVKSHFTKFYTFYLHCPANEVQEFIDMIRKYEIVLAKKVNGEKHYLCKPEDVYFSSLELVEFLSAKSDAWFLDEDYYQSLNLPKPEKLKDFFAQLGIQSKPTLHIITLRSGSYYQGEWITPNIISKRYAPGISSWERSTGYQKWSIPIVDGVVEALDKIEKSHTLSLSEYLWNLLLSLCKELRLTESIYSTLTGSFYGEYEYYYRTTRIRHFETALMQAFQNKAWIQNDQGNFVKPFGLNVKHLASIYDVKNPYKDKVIEFLHLKIDVDAPEAMLSEDQLAKQRIAEFGRENGLSDEEMREALAKAAKEKRERAALAEQERNLVTSKDSLDEEGNDDYLSTRIPSSKTLHKVFKDIDQISSQHKERTYDSKDASDTENDINLSDYLLDDDTNLDDEDEYIHPTVDYQKKIAKEKEKSAQEINLLALTQENEEEAQNAKKYSFKWFKALLNLEIINNGQAENNKRSFSINFGRVQKETGTNRTLILEHPDRYIPQSMEDLADIALVLRSDDFERTVPIEVVNVRSYTLRAKLKSTDSIHDIDLSTVKQASISVQDPIFLLDELKKGLFALPFDDSYNLQTHLCTNIHFIFGPPGTGKTTHLATNVIEPLMSQKKSARILVLTPTNKAADVLTSRIMSSYSRDHYQDWLIRFGVTGDAKIESSGVYREKTIDITKLERCTVVTTIARFPYDFFMPGDGSRTFLHGINWDYIIIDEASMIPLVNMIYVLYKKTPCEFIIAGDPLQIQPITSVDIWKDENIYTMVGLQSFKSNTVTKPHQYPVERLMTQYRSIPSVGNIFSNFAYEGSLQHSRREDDCKKLNLDSYMNIAPLNIIKFPVSKYESIYRAKRLIKSNYQIYSALFCFEFSRFLAEKLNEKNPIGNFSIGIIAPYRAEADLIEKLVATLTVPKGITIQVGTIHGFQGDECDIVIAVFNAPPRISDSPNMFLNKKNIINVAISRARDYLFVIMPDNKTEGIENLKLVKKVEALCRLKEGNCTVYQASAIEKIMFGQEGYLEENSFTTSHQSVNVYGLPERKYEIRSEETAVDIQVHERLKNDSPTTSIITEKRSEPRIAETTTIQQLSEEDSSVDIQDIEKVIKDTQPLENVEENHNQTHIINNEPPQPQKVVEQPSVPKEAFVYVDYYQLNAKTNKCPLDGHGLLYNSKVIQCFDGKKRKLNFQQCTHCLRNFAFRFGDAVDLSIYAIRKHEIPKEAIMQQAAKQQGSTTNSSNNHKSSDDSHQIYCLSYQAKLQIGDKVYNPQNGSGTVISKRLSGNSQGTQYSIVKVRFSKIELEYHEDMALQTGALKKK